MECFIRDVMGLLWLRYAENNMLGNATSNDAIVGICSTLVIHASSSALESLAFLLFLLFSIPASHASRHPRLDITKAGMLLSSKQTYYLTRFVWILF